MMCAKPCWRSTPPANWAPWSVAAATTLFSVNYFGRRATIILAGSDRLGSVPTTLMPVDGVGGARAVQSGVENALASTRHAGTVARARFPRRWHHPQAARIPDRPGVQEVDRRRVRGNSGPGARPRGAGDGGVFRRDRSVL